jgi:AmmeMemoRadiSam system protein B
MPGIAMLHARRPAAAGVFYPADREKLVQTLAELLRAAESAPAAPLPARIRAIVVPHAVTGTAGITAAAAWSRIGPATKVQRVLLLGPSHHLPLAGMAAPFADAFATPLGPVPIDRIALEGVRHFPHMSWSDLPHDQEPSLEAQLPFLQTRVPDAMIVPLVVGELPDVDAATMIDALWTETTLTVVSTDLSRYFDKGTASRLDEVTARAIERLDPTPIGEQQACGHAALRALLLVAQARRMRATRLDLRTSATPGSEAEDVVGYGAFAIG